MRRAFPAAIALCAVGLTGCGKAAVAGQSAKTLKTLPATTVPATVGGLDTQAESVAASVKTLGGALTYADAIGYWSLRKNKLVQATLQITHLGPTARVGDATFVSTLLGGLGFDTTKPTRIGDYNVFLSTGSTVNSAAWLEGDYVVELSTRLTYAFPRTLLEGVAAVTL